MTEEELIKHCQKEVEIAERIRRYDKHYLEHKLVLDKIKENKELNKKLQKVSDEFLKYDWANSTVEQCHNQLKNLYEAIFRKNK